MKTRLLLPIIVLTGCQQAPQANKPAADSTKAPVAAASTSDGRIPADTVVVSWEGGKLTYGEFIAEKKADFQRLERKQIQERFQAESQALEGWIVEKLMKQEATKAGLTEEEHFKKLTANAEVSEAEIQAFYEQRVKPSGQPLEAVRPRIVDFLKGQKSQGALMAEIERLKKAANVEMNLPTPEALKVEFDLADRPRKGKEGAKVTIVEFSDFECPYCSRANTELAKVMEAYPDQIEVYFLHFPLSFHKQAMPAAIASRCAQKQGKFWPMHDAIFASQSSLSPEKITATATEVGLDKGAFDTCMKDPEVAAFVKKDMEQGEKAGVQGTPSFFINGEQYPKGVPTVDAIKPYLEAKS